MIALGVLSLYPVITMQDQGDLAQPPPAAVVLR